MLTKKIEEVMRMRNLLSETTDFMMKEKNCKNCLKRIDKKCIVTDTYTPRKKPACADFEAKK